MIFKKLKLTGLTLACSAAVLLAGCYGDGDGGKDAANADDDYGFIAETSPGIYRSVLHKSDGDVALVRAYLSDDGNIFVAVEEDDSEKATSLYKTHTESADQLPAQLSKLFVDGTLTVPQRSEEADLETSLLDLQGTFAISGDTGLQSLQIDSEGNVILSGTCDATGNVTSTAAGVNLYKLVVNGGCGNYTAFVHLSTIETGFDVLHVISSGANANFDQDYFRI